MTKINPIIRDLCSLPEGKFTLCYGTFNIIHPGHLRYLESAKKHGLKLVVAVENVLNRKGNQKERIFSLTQRAKSLAQLRIVDYVIAIDGFTLVDLVNLLKPENIVLGREYADDTGLVSKTIQRIKEYGGKVYFDAGEVHYANSDLYHDNYTNERQKRENQLKEISKKHKIQEDSLLRAIKDFNKMKLLVVGDTILDQYVGCDALGMSSEAPVLVVKELESRLYIGGAAVVASHIAALGAECFYVSVVGNDSQASSIKEMLADSRVKVNLISDESRPTTFKTRFIVEKQKVFRLSRLKDHILTDIVEDKVIRAIKRIGNQVDGIVISDFVYGVITPKVLDAISEVAKKKNIKIFGDIQCSTQHGDIKKFKNFDSIFPTEKEARIALGSNDDGVESVAKSLLELTNASNLVLKMVRRIYRISN